MLAKDLRQYKKERHVLAVIVGAPYFRFECPRRDGIEAAQVTVQRPEEIGGGIADQNDKQGQDRPSPASWSGCKDHAVPQAVAAGAPGWVHYGLLKTPWDRRVF